MNVNKHKFTKDNVEAASPALQRLQETLTEHKVGLDITRPMPALSLRNRLYSAIPQLQTHSLKEILLAGDAGATAKVLATVLDAATDPNVTIGRRLCPVIYTDNSSVKIPIAAAGQHDWGEPKREAEETTSFVTINVQKSSGLANILKDMIEDAEWDIVERQLRELGRAAFEFQSNYVIDTMVTNAGNTDTADSSGVLDLVDIADMYALMKADNCEPDVIVVNPTEQADLVKDTTLHNYLNWRQLGPLGQGSVIPYIGNMKLEVSNLLASGTALLVDTRRAGALVIRRDITIAQYDDVVNDLVALPCTQRWNFDELDANGIGTITTA